MPRVVLDTNVYISAIIFGGKPRELLDKIISGNVELFFSPAIIEELTGVLLRPKFHFTESFIRQIVSELVSLGDFVSPGTKIEEITDDPEDNRILERAVECNAEYIVTGDRHLLDLGNFRKTEIVTVADFLYLWNT